MNDARQVPGDESAADAGDPVTIALQYLDNPTEIPADLGPSARRLLEAITAARGDLAAFEAVAPVLPDPPPLDQDPMAVALGLVPGAELALSGPKLRAARQRAKLKVSQIARKVSDGHENLAPDDLLSWEQITAVPVDAELLARIASAVGVEPKELAERAPAIPRKMAASPQFRDLVTRWAAHTHQSLVAAQTALMRVAVAPAARGTGNEEAIIATLQIWVDHNIGQDQ